MKKIVSLFFVLWVLTNLGYSQGTQQQQSSLKIAIVAPLYIDSAFDKGMIKEGNLPKYMNAGLDFIQGAEIALDTLQTSGKKIDVYMIDSRAPVRNLQWMLKYGGLDKMDLIIGGVKEPEYQELAYFAKDHNIPFISAIYPNDGAVRKDPYLVIMNSTLQTHVEGLFSYIVQRHSMDQILLIKQRNDNRIDNYFKEANKVNGKNLLKINSIAVDSINSSQLALLIDTLKPAVVIGASLNEWFALNTADACYPYRNKVTLVGMPNWDGFRDLYNKERYKDFPILFSTPHLDEVKSEFSSYLANKYFTIYRAKPGDMAMKGFEATWYFTNLMMAYGDSLMEHLNDDRFACFHEFNFRPVSLNNSGDIDYFENKHIFMMQILNGIISKLW